MLERLDSQLVDSTPIELVLLAELGRMLSQVILAILVFVVGYFLVV